MNNNNNDWIKWMIIILTPCLCFVFFFFFIDNPAVHGGSAWVKYNGEVESCYLTFDLLGSKYHRRYVRNSGRLHVYPLDDHRKTYSPRPKLKNNELSFCYSDVPAKMNNGSSSFVHFTETLDRRAKYAARLEGKHKGVIFNRSAKDIYFEFTIEHIKADRVPENIIFASSQKYYCDGVYNPSAIGEDSPSALYVNLGNEFNRDFFEISLEYYMLPRDDSRDSNGVLFSLDKGNRVLGVSLGDYLDITLNNGEHIYGTAIKNQSDTWMKLDLCYDHGRLFVNGLSFTVERINDLGIYGDNILSSMNYGNGECFKGYIRNLVVKSDGPQNK